MSRSRLCAAEGARVGLGAEEASISEVNFENTTSRERGGGGDGPSGGRRAGGRAVPAGTCRGRAERTSVHAHSCYPVQIARNFDYPSIMHRVPCLALCACGAPHWPP